MTLNGMIWFVLSFSAAGSVVYIATQLGFDIAAAIYILVACAFYLERWARNRNYNP